MRIKSMALAVVFSVFLGVCSASCLTLTEKDNGSVVNLAVGQTLEITLASNISTGYTWNIISIDTAILEQVGEKEYVQDVMRKGGGGHTTFRFKGAGRGKSSLMGTSWGSP